MKQKITNIFIFIILWAWAVGQEHTISGITVDTANGNPVAGVNIILGGSDEGTASDVEGKFIFSTQKVFPLTLNISHIAYNPLVIIVENDSTLLIGLTPSVITGQEIEVMGARRIIEIDVASAVDRIDIEAIEVQGARDMGSALRRMSGIRMNYANSGKQTVSIRGSNATDVAVFLDGVRINDANTGVADLSFIDLNSIAQIQVVKGGGSSLFGGDAIGGVVNVESKNATKNSAYFTQGKGQTYGDDLDLSYGATGVLGPVGIGGRFSGKKRAYGGRTVTNSIFQNLFGGVDFLSGRFDLRWVDLKKYLKFQSGSITADDGLDVLSGTYNGSILKSKAWKFMVGQRNWRMDQDYFTSIHEELKDGTTTLQVSKGIDIYEIKNTLQLENEKQFFDGDRLSFDVESMPLEKRKAQMVRSTRGLALVSRWSIMGDSPVVDHINWELGLRFNLIETRLDETGWYYENGFLNDNPVYTSDEISMNLFTKRLGVHIDGQTNRLRYSLFINQGNNSRLPTLNDRFRFTHAVFDSSMDTTLTREHLNATEINMDLTFTDIRTDLPITEMGFLFGLFINDYNNKIAYRPVDQGPPIPFNDLTADIRGAEIRVVMKMAEGKFNLSSGGTFLSVSNYRAFPNKPKYRFVTSAELNLNWVSISLDHINEGEQYYYVTGFGEGFRKPSENANLNISLNKKLWKIHCSLSYTIRNMMSKEELDMTLEDSIRKGFNYFERYREIVMLKVSL